jgi:DNA-directed RNA polymerase specialized sigma24 family protein
VTRLFPLALAGDGQAQDQLFRLTEPVARQMAIRWLRQYTSLERIGVTELLDQAFVRLVPPPGAEQPRPESWPHKGRFYALLCRSIWRALIDLLRRDNTFTNSTVLPELLADALQGNEAIAKLLTETGGSPDQVAAVLSDMIWGDRTAQRILAEGGDPSKVQRTVRDLLGRQETQRALQDAGPNGQRLRDVLIDVVCSEAARKKLILYRPLPQEGSDGGGLAGVAEPQLDLTRNSILTLHQALEDLDQEFAQGPDAAPPVLEGLKPRRSSHAQIIDLRLIGNCTWEQVADYLDMRPGTAVSQCKVAVEYLRERLGDAFSGVFNEVQPPQA